MRGGNGRHVRDDDSIHSHIECPPDLNFTVTRDARDGSRTACHSRSAQRGQVFYRDCTVFQVKHDSIEARDHSHFDNFDPRNHDESTDHLGRQPQATAQAKV